LDLLPGASATVTARVEGAFPLIVDKATVRAQGVASAAGGDGSVVAGSSSVRFLAVPWLLLALIAIVVGVLMVGRRRREPVVSPSAEATSESVSST
jgi:hypothetical protein